MVRTVFIALVLFCGAAHAEATGFLGNWENPRPGPGGLMHVQISPNGGDRVGVRAYGNCHPNECNWGLVEGKIYTADPKSDDVKVIVATFQFGFAQRRITFHIAPGGRLRFEMLIDFDDGSNRHPFVARGLLQHTGWAGPLSQVWQRQPGLATGWGGGARGGNAPRPAEQCTTFDTHGARAVAEDGVWVVTAGGHTLVRAGHDGRAAMIAAAVFRHYHFDRRCTVGGPWQAYWKSDDGFADEKIGGTQCVSFHPTTAHLTRIGGEWAIVDSTTDVAKFGNNKLQADATLGLIRYHQLTARCFVRRADPIMAFWLGAPD